MNKELIMNPNQLVAFLEKPCAEFTKEDIKRYIQQNGPTDVNEKFRFELLRSKLLPQFCKHSESVDLLHKSLLPHVWRVPSSKALSCKHERLFDLLTLASYFILFYKIYPHKYTRNDVSIKSLASLLPHLQ